MRERQIKKRKTESDESCHPVFAQQTQNSSSGVSAGEGQSQGERDTWKRAREDNKAQVNRKSETFNDRGMCV